MRKNNIPDIGRTAMGPLEYLDRKDGGRNSKQVVITVHGALGGYDQSDILGKTVIPPQYRYIAVSRPGYLGTPMNNNGSPEAQADMTTALLDYLGINRAVVCAISGGGYSAIHFALRHPDRCRGLILCSTTGGRIKEPVPFAFHMMKFFAHIPFLTKLMRKRIEKNPEKAVGKSIVHQDMADALINNPEAMGLCRDLLISTMTDMPKRMAGTMNDVKITHEVEYPLRDITVPTLVIHGDEDPIVPYSEHGKRLYLEIPGAQMCLAERGEHMAIFTHMEQVRAAAAGFLSAVF